MHCAEALTLYQSQILDSSKLKDFADDNPTLNENVRTFSKREENNVGKGEIARNEQFLLFFTVFSKVLYYRHGFVCGQTCTLNLKTVITSYDVS